MTNLDTLSGSGERLSFYTLFSRKKFKVEIPIIQRDYAQGRGAEIEVRESFLNALYEYLQDGKANRDLDFVYGSLLSEGDLYRFVPLDGQQRLTTLFLLHWYLSQLSGQAEQLREVLCLNNRSLFTYETRTSSREFCDALMACDIDVSSLLERNGGSTTGFSRTIQDKGWFYSYWENDPTIQSMLTMLDSIHAKFSGNPEFFDRLIDDDRPVITFLFLNLHEFNLTDDLYIKMNARGKPLTAFENFKAKFEQRIKTFNGEWPLYKLVFDEKPVNGYQYFIHKIDTDWADVFWAYRNVCSEDNTFDDELMNFIGLVTANYCLLDKSTEPNSRSKRIDSFLGFRGIVRRLSFQEYDKLGCVSQGLVMHLIKMMDLLHNDGSMDGKIRPYLDHNDYYCEDDGFKKIISNDTSYQEKLLFYAFYTSISSWGSGDGLVEWLRVVYNLTENTIINTAEEYRSALLSLSELSKNEFILVALKDDCDVSAFTGVQVLEEKIKAHLLNKSNDWKELIINVEKHPFFRGQIGFALNFSGILKFYRDNSSCDWEQSKNSAYFDAFKKYSSSGAKVFSLIKDSSSAIDYLWERAVLSKGIYFTKTSADRWNMLSTRLGKNNIERDHSWKRLLRIVPPYERTWEERQACVKAVFDDPHFDADDIKGSLATICKKALEDNQLEEWKKTFIKHKELFEICNQGFIVKNVGEIMLLHQSQRNHYHSELYSKVLYLELNSEQIYPFTYISYTDVKSRDDLPSLSISGWRYEDVIYRIEIYYVLNQYNVKFKALGSEGLSKNLVDVLTKHKFELDDLLEFFYEYKDDSREGVINTIKDLCLELKELTDE